MLREATADGGSIALTIAAGRACLQRSMRVTHRPTPGQKCSATVFCQITSQPGRRRPGFFMRNAACNLGACPYLTSMRRRRVCRQFLGSSARSEMAGLFRAGEVHVNALTRDELRAFSASQRAYPNTSQGVLLRRQKPRAQSLRAVEDAPATLQGRELQRMQRRFENWKQCVAWATPLRCPHWALTAPNDRLATSLKIHVLEASDKARNRLRHCSRRRQRAD
jgi:hypothetical protein